MKNKNLIYIFGLGLISLMGGVVYLYVEQHLNIPAAVFCFGGLVSLVFCLVISLRSSSHSMAGPRWKKWGTILLIATLSMGTFVAINCFTIKLPWRWDVTRFKQHTLSPSTIKFIQGLRQNVQFSALYVGIPPSYLEDLFKEYEKASNGRIKTEIIDPIEQIGYASQFGNVINGQQSKVVVRSGKERRDVDFSQAPLSEEQLTNALVRVTRQARHLYFLTGHGEYSAQDKGTQGLTTFFKLLTENNMSAQELMLGIAPVIPKDCDVLIVPGVQDDLTKVEDAAIEQYLEQGGKALFLIGNVLITTPDKPLTDEELRKDPSLNEILNQWGINVGEDIVMDLDSHAGDDVGSPATRNYVGHTSITEGLDYTFYIRPRSITVLKSRRSSIELAPIVMTGAGDRSWAHTDRTTKVYFDPKTDTAGPIPIAYAIMEKKKDPAKPDTRIIVITNPDFLTNVYIGQYSNARMGLNAVNWLSESNAKVFVDPKNVKVEQLDLTSKQKRMVAAILFLMPVFICACGVIMWMRR